jgi:hypothetical protein
MVMNFIEEELGKVKGKNEGAIKRGREARLNKLLSDGKVSKGMFADPAAMLKG